MSNHASFDRKWEDNIYSQGHQLNKYPISDIVAYVMRLYGEQLKSGDTLRVLELGFGGGNNIIFFSEEGFDTYGIEGSPSAHSIAMKKLEKRNLQAKLIVGDLVKLPYSDNYFDLVVDRESIYCNVPGAISQIIGEVHRVLKNGVGIFLTFMYSLDHGGRLLDNGKIVDENTFTDFTKGKFANTGVTHFFSKGEILDYLKDFELVFMKYQKVDNIFPEQGNEYAEYHTCVRKK
jgi:ubiquinone/menaquinone biosynthesis C-methylase UbiE